MPGIEKMHKKKREPEDAPEEQKPVLPKWSEGIADMIFKRLGGKPSGYVKHAVIPMWADKYRMNVLLHQKKDPGPGKPDSGQTVEKYLSWWLEFTPTGELVISNPALPGSVTPADLAAGN